MTNITVVYLDPIRRERLRAAFADNITLLGPMRTAQLVNAIQYGYSQHRSPRANYNFALHALGTVAGLVGLNAIAIVKEAWNVGSLIPRLASNYQQPVAAITHPSTNTTQ